jgi:probable DNA repair protein
VTTVTATPRLARSLAREYAAARLREGKRAWRTPDILPWDRWILRLWKQQCPDGAVWNDWQEQALWEQAIGSDGLLRTHGAAALARRAWYLLHAWNLPLDGSDGDGSPFPRWAERYLAASSRLDGARIPSRLDPARIPSGVRRAGFDHLTPQQHRLLANAAPVAPQTHPMSAVRVGLPGVAAEIEAAAEWARDRLRGNPEARIGVVIAGLEPLRACVEHTFHSAIGGAFHLSLGAPLAKHPVVHAALAVLALTNGTLPLPAWTRLLLSPYLTGNWKLDLALRRDCLEEAPIAAVVASRACPPLLRHTLADCGSRILTWPERQFPSFYAAEWSRLLQAFGWPGGQVLSSEEHQAREAFHEALSRFASLDAIRLSLTPAEALSRFSSHLAARPFQVEDRGEPVQVMNIDEAAGLTFDHLWIAGLDDVSWPPPPQPNPLLPVALQRSRGIPLASPAAALEWARQVTSNLFCAAPEVICSHATARGEQPLNPSPLIAALRIAAPKHCGAGPWLAAGSQPAPIITINDETAPAIPHGTHQRGGARTLKLQAACPFRAFAEVRLKATPLEAPGLGFDPRQRGNHLHVALEHCWQTGESPEQYIEQAARQAVENLPEWTAFQTKRKDLERRRLQALLTAWLQYESQRETPFQVLPPEQESEVQIGGLCFKTRIDRLDRLPDGRAILIDYKSTAPTASAWEGDRPDEPQLPLYAATSAHTLAGALFAQVKAGEMKFTGLVAAPGLVPGPRPVTPQEFAAAHANWTKVLESLAVRFREGIAEVDPKKGEDTCSLCHLKTLCRVHEQ